MVCPEEYFLCTWEECVSCCNWVVYVMYICYILLVYSCISFLVGLTNSNLLIHSFGSYNSKIKVSVGFFPSAGCEEGSVQCLSLSFWLIARNVWWFLAWRNITLTFVFMLAWCFLAYLFASKFLFTSAPVILEQGLTLLQCKLILA